MSQAEVPFDLRSLTGLLVGERHREPFTALSRTHVSACATWSRVSPPHLIAFTAPSFVLRVHAAQGRPLKTGLRSVHEGRRHFGPLPTAGPWFFHLSRPQGPGRLGPGHIEGLRGSQHPNRRKNRRMNQAAGQGWGCVLGEDNIPQRSCWKPTELAQDHSNLLGSWPARGHSSHPPGWH